MHDRIHERVERAIEDCVFPGCVIGIIAKGSAHVYPFGGYTYEPDSPRVECDSVYDCASITKSIPLATLALKAIEKGKLRLSDTLITYVPEYDGTFRDAIAIHHLMTYTAPSISFASLKYESAEKIFEGIMHMHSENAPGKRFIYANVPAFLLGLVLERIMGPLDRAAHGELFAPLSMHASTFWPIHAVPTEEGIQAVVHDESARAFKKQLRAVGHAGLFSSVPDLLHFVDVLLRNDGTILLQETVQTMSTNQIPHLKEETGLGWELNQRHWMGAHCTAHTFGKTGFTGTSVLCDIEMQKALVILSNRTYPVRPKDATSINAVRRDIADIVFGSS